jgi:dolichyl-diphosphooligosaccharide---protein glycosyltransferase
VFKTLKFLLSILRIDRFNYRATAYMVQHGFYEFLNWFDERAWYPLGNTHHLIDTKI